MISLRAKPGSGLTLSSGRFEWRDVGSLARENNLHLVRGLCLPASCSTEKVVSYSNSVMSEADLEVIEPTCRTNDSVAFKLIDYFSM